MNAERLLALYERIADAPDAVGRLRRFVLDLAVRGRLVAQDASEEPASDLLKRIAFEKARLQTLGEVRSEKPLPKVIPKDLDSALPAGWSVARLGDVAACLDYRREPINANEREARIAGKDQEKLFPYYGATQQQGWIDDYIFDGEFILLGEDGVPFHDRLRPKAYLITGKSWVNNHAHVFRAVLISPRFLVHCLNVFDYSGRVVGATRAKLNQAQAVTIRVALPPLAEQHRIVAKVDELMALCDRLEASRAEREATRDRLAAASLARLNAPDPDTFRDDARFALDALPALTTRLDQIKQLRQTILGLATVGQLTVADDESGHASEDLTVIEKKKLLKALRKPRKIPPISPEEAWCDIPSNWAWARWDQLTDWITYGFTRPMPHENEGIPIVTGKNVNLGRIIFETAHRTPRKAFDELNEKDRPSPGDILVTKDGSIGRTAIVDTSEPFCINQSVAVLWLRSCHLDRRYLKLVLDCPQTQERLQAKTEGVAIKHISVVDLGAMVLPIPPLAEQHRIVAKVDELMALCDRLEASLAQGDTARRRLLDALLAEALAPATTVDEGEPALT